MSKAIVFSVSHPSLIVGILWAERDRLIARMNALHASDGRNEPDVLVQLDYLSDGLELVTAQLEELVDQVDQAWSDSMVDDIGYDESDVDWPDNEAEDNHANVCADPSVDYVCDDCKVVDFYCCPQCG